MSLFPPEVTQEPDFIQKRTVLRSPQISILGQVFLRFVQHESQCLDTCRELVSRREQLQATLTNSELPLSDTEVQEIQVGLREIGAQHEQANLQYMLLMGLALGVVTSAGILLNKDTNVDSEKEAIINLLRILAND
jgi:hypothetical protein